MTRLLPILFVSLMPGFAAAAERDAPSPLCAEDLPDGAHLSAARDCRPAPAQKAQGHEFRDLGNGVSVRVGGRVGAEYGVRR